jgi:hypothetical protein
MTRQRLDNHSTEFGLWLREQPELDSSLGFITSNLDYIWSNYKTEEYMLIEEKRFCAQLSLSQKKLFDKIDKNCRNDRDYKGFHKLIFQNTSPEDGAIILCDKIITKEQLIKFLRFEKICAGFHYW